MPPHRPTRQPSPLHLRPPQPRPSAPWWPCVATTARARRKTAPPCPQAVVAALVIGAMHAAVTGVLVAPVHPPVQAAPAIVVAALVTAPVATASAVTTAHRAARAWATPPSAPSATRWNTRRPPLKSWPRKRTAKR